jgi:hypothetical protein
VYLSARVLECSTALALNPVPANGKRPLFAKDAAEP